MSWTSFHYRIFIRSWPSRKFNCWFSLADVRQACAIRSATAATFSVRIGSVGYTFKSVVKVVKAVVMITPNSFPELGSSRRKRDLKPYTLSYDYCDWWSIYQVHLTFQDHNFTSGQRTAPQIQQLETGMVFVTPISWLMYFHSLLSGDAVHTPTQAWPKVWTFRYRTPTTKSANLVLS